MAHNLIAHLYNTRPVALSQNATLRWCQHADKDPAADNVLARTHGEDRVCWGCSARGLFTLVCSHLCALPFASDSCRWSALSLQAHEKTNTLDQELKKNINRRKRKGLCHPLVVDWSTAPNTERHQRCRVEFYPGSLLFLITPAFWAADGTVMAAVFCAA